MGETIFEDDFADALEAVRTRLAAVTPDSTADEICSAYNDASEFLRRMDDEMANLGESDFDSTLTFFNALLDVSNAVGECNTSLVNEISRRASVGERIQPYLAKIFFSEMGVANVYADILSNRACEFVPKDLHDKWVAIGQMAASQAQDHGRRLGLLS